MKIQEKAQHTPGPWETMFNDEVMVVHPMTGSKNYRFVALMDTHVDTGRAASKEERAENVANARLIASSPDLKWSVQALLNVVNALAQGKPWNNHMAEIERISTAHLAKAEGR